MVEPGPARGGGDEQGRADDALRYVVSGSSGNTVEAVVEMLGRFASGARRATGLRALVARASVLLVLVPLLLTVAWGVVTLPSAFR